jgi:uncharacterized LabA/DUF88 family protein
MKSSPRVAVFIDASNLWEAQKVKGCLFDFAKLKQYITSTYSTKELKIFYYTAYPANGTRDYSLDGKHKFFTYLSKALGYTVRKKELKQIHIQTKAGILVEEKGNMDVEMVIDALHYKDSYDIVLLFTGDSDFLALVSYLRTAGKKVFIYSSKNNISSELRTGADGYVELLDITENIWGNQLKHRSQK